MANSVLGNSLMFGAGFGLEVGYGVGTGRITGELGYSVQTGDQFKANISSMAGSDSTVTVDTANSIESRKNKVDGLTLRFGYEAPLTTSMTWHAGLQFGGNKFTHQVIGNVAGTYGAAKTPYTDSYWSASTKNSMAPSLFGGVALNLNEESAIEFGVTLLQYTSLNYQHIAHSNNSNDTIATSNRIVPTFEIAYVFRF
jgi:hypothetical protein